jgi:hypothetical protein
MFDDSGCEPGPRVVPTVPRVPAGVTVRPGEQRAFRVGVNLKMQRVRVARRPRMGRHA